MKLFFVKYYGLIIRFLLFTGFMLLPLIFWPWATIPYEIPRVRFVKLWIEILSVIGLFSSLFLFQKRKQNLVLLLLFIIFISISLAASYFGVDFTKSLAGNYFRDDGLLTLFYLFGFYLFISLFFQKNWFYPLALSVSLGSFVISLWTVISSFRLLILSDLDIAHMNNAVVTSFGHPQFAAGYLLVTLPFVLFLIKVNRLSFLKILLYFSFILQISALLLTFSRGCFIGLILFFWLIFLLRKKVRRISVWVLSIIFFTFLAAGVYLFIFKDSGFIAEGRERIVRKILLGVLESPFLGFGLANVDYAFGKNYWPIPLQHDVYVDKAHSQILEVLATTGLLGLAVYLSIIVYIVKKLFHCVLTLTTQSLWEKTLFLVFLLYLFHSQTNVISIGEEIYFWLIAGIVGNRYVKD